MAKARAASKKRPNAVVRYVRETIAELRKVNWPTRKDAIRLTLIVLVVVGVSSAFLAVMDYLFTKLIALLLGAR
ncbi:MAG: preprotein translocase subunit SecE [Anaerolineales bacterium]